MRAVRLDDITYSLTVLLGNEDASPSMTSPRDDILCDGPTPRLDHWRNGSWERF